LYLVIDILYINNRDARQRERVARRFANKRAREKKETALKVIG